MTTTQREAALRLADWLHASGVVNSEVKETIALLRELLAEPQGEPVAWHVCSVNSDGALSLEFAAPWEELAHEHINDAINEHDIDGATSWVVRPVYASPQPQQTEPAAWLSLDDARIALWQAIKKRDFVNPTDDKLILEALHKAGLWIARLDTHPAQQRKPLTPSMQAEAECDCLVAWHASTYGHSAQDTVHPMFLSAFISGYRAAERAHGITGEPT